MPVSKAMTGGKDQGQKYKRENNGVHKASAYTETSSLIYSGAKTPILKSRPN
ncbi:MAG TPA: hypothetical protein VII44_04440 [Puia sp.]